MLPLRIPTWVPQDSVYLVTNIRVAQSRMPRPRHSAPVRAVTPVVPLPSGEAMDLSAAQAAVKGRKLSEPNVKTICDKWRLCYYCKLSHPGLVAKNCPNRTTQLRSGSVTELEDDQSVAGGVPLDAGKV